MTGSFWEAWASLWNVDLWVTVLLGASIKGGLVLLVVLAGSRILKGISSAFRHLLITLGLVVALVLPVVSLLLPVWEVPVLEVPSWEALSDDYRWTPNLFRRKEVAPEVGMGPGAGYAGSAPAVRRALPPAMPAASPDSRYGADGEPAAEVVADQVVTTQNGWPALEWPRWPVIILSVWLSVALLLFAKLLLGVWLVHREVGSAAPVEDERWLALLEGVLNELKLRKKVRLLQSARLEVALSAGLWRATVLVPEVSETWSSERRRAILLHELAHIKRRDNLVNLIAQVSTTLYWFHPLVWWASRQLLIERERACDDQVLETGMRASEYAAHLLSLSRAISSRRLWAPVEISQSSGLKDRLMAVLDPLRNRRFPGIGVRVAVSTVSILLVLPVSALQPWATPSMQEATVALNRIPERNPSAAHRHAPFSGMSGPSRRPSESGRNAVRAEKMTLREIADPTVRDGASGGPAPAIRLPGLVSEEMPGRHRSLSAILRASSIPGSGSALPALMRPEPEPVGEFAMVFGRGQTRARTDGEGSEAAADPTAPSEVIEVNRIELGTLGGLESRATGINDAGLVVGESQTEGGVFHPFSWSQSFGMLDLAGSLPVHSRATRVNQQGQVLCETFGTFVFRGYLWSLESGMVDIGALDGTFPLTFPNALNEEGVVVGASRNRAGTLRAFAWSEAMGMVDLGAPGWSEALSVNNLGQVVGYGNNEAFLWDPVNGVQLIMPADVRFAVATDINDEGKVVGYAEFEDGITRAFLWSVSEGHSIIDTQDPLYPHSMALGINEAGEVVGQAVAIPLDGPVRVRAFRWTEDQGAEDIGSSLSVLGSEKVPESDLAINALGQIVGVYSDALLETDSPNALVWTEGGVIALDSEIDSGASQPVASNSHNQFVGSYLSTEKLRTAVLWELRVSTGVPEAQDYP